LSFTQREARTIIRKAVGRVPEGEEIRHLNIMPMMDMMTILLVAFIAQAATSSSELAARQVSLPPTPTSDELPADATTLIVTKNGIVVNVAKGAETIISLTNGQPDAADIEGGLQGNKIPKLSAYLGNLRNIYQANAAKKPGYDPTKQPPPELMIIADRTTSYGLLIRIMYSAKQPEAGFKRFRLIVQKAFPAKP
jgi:biopolymer transport protein ExbD